jgi:hypothetical protein
MKTKQLKNGIYQVIEDGNVLFQGNKDEYMQFMMDRLFDKITNTPKLLDVFKRMKDR